ncbi:MAG TPA: hypothetical protein VLB44_08440 [Kofleriaceae bacterium]|nr:hypothetical protein [Kofleriaceae bacterium]
MQREDYLIRLIRQVAQFLARIAGHRDKGEHRQALAETERAWSDVIGHPRELVDVVDTPTLASMLREPEKMRAAARLLFEEGKTRAASGDPVHATICYRRAVELTLEAKAIEPHPDDEVMLFELGRVVQMNQLDPRYRADGW